MATPATNQHHAHQSPHNQRRIDKPSHRKAAIASAVAVVGAVAALLVAFLVWPESHAATPASTSSTTSAGSSAGGLLPGVSRTPPPWQPEYANLPARLTALHMPNPGSEKYHIHAHLTVFVDGAEVSVPTDIGMDEAHGVAAAMHTHEADGVIHVEADAESDVFTLGSFFDVWGVALSRDRLGSFTNAGNKTVQLYANGKKVDDPDSFLLHQHDNLVLAYGTDSSFPHTVDYTFPNGE